MRKIFVTKEGLVFAISFVAFAATGSLPALAQSVSAYGSPLPIHYNAAGERVPGWFPQTPSVRQLAHGQPTNNDGLSAFAQAPATISVRRAAHRRPVNHSGLNAFALAPATIQPTAPLFSTVPSSLGLTERFGAGSQS
jgi:hypothetical protein